MHPPPNIQLRFATFLLAGVSLALFLTACSPANTQTIKDVEQTEVRNQITVAHGNRGCMPGTATPAATEGPYYKVGSPHNSHLLTDAMTGQRLVLSGHVYDIDCKPLANALVDVWQADEDGVYDNKGYKLRGHTYTNAEGMYSVETEVPGLYEGRTLHIHAKVAAATDVTVLTTQLFFPGVEANTGDGIFREDLLIDLDTSTTPWNGTFDFVLPR